MSRKLPDNWFFDLPCRRPRGSPENMVRALMALYLISGLNREQAEAKALGILGLKREDLKLAYSGET